MSLTSKILSFLCVLGALAGHAQKPVENSLLWEIRGPGNSRPSYLFGTIHLICPADFSLSDSLKSAFQKSEQLALEVDMDDPGLGMAMMKSAAMKGGQKLRDLFSEEEYARLAKYYQDSVKMDLGMFVSMKPFFLMAPLFGPLLSCTPQSYEMSLVELASERKIEVVGIEGIEEQMSIVDSIPYKDQAKMIVKLVDDIPKARKEFTELVAQYKAGNIEELQKMTAASEFGMEHNEAIFLSERNKKWIPRMQKFMLAKPTFFAVGAAHLGGDDGVIALLRKDGFSVRPVIGRK